MEREFELEIRMLEKKVARLQRLMWVRGTIMLVMLALILLLAYTLYCSYNLYLSVDDINQGLMRIIKNN